MKTVSPTPSINNLRGHAWVGDSILKGAAASGFGPYLLAVFELEIKNPPSDYDSSLYPDIDNLDTYLLNEALEEISPIIKTNGYIDSVSSSNAAEPYTDKDVGSAHSELDTSSNVSRKLPDFADGRFVELVIGLNEKFPNAFAELTALVRDYGGEISDTISMDSEIVAAVVNITLEQAYPFKSKVEPIGLSTYIEPNYVFRAWMVPNDPLWQYQWGSQKIDVDWAWNTTLGDPSILVAVIDTGIDYNHSDLSDNYARDEQGNPLGYNFVNNTMDPMDDNGHGTHCAGIMAAVINNGEGIAGLAQVRIMAEKVLDSEGRGLADNIAQGIINATDYGADIISMNLGMYYNPEVLKDAIEYAYNKGVLLVAAAGNDATRARTFPAAYEEVIAVAATNETDNAWQFSNYGDWIGLTAPGVNITSTYLANSYQNRTGTSHAAPHVSGVAALLWSQHPNWTRDNIRYQLRFTADDLGISGFDERCEWGRINSKRAVEEGKQQHDLGIIRLDMPLYLLPNQTFHMKTTIVNFGQHDEYNVTVSLKMLGITVDYDRVSVMTSGAVVMFNTFFTPPTGIYKISSSVTQVPGETRISNNKMTVTLTVREPTVLYVPQNYTTIQSAIDAALPFDVIKVSNGMYYEHLVVNKAAISIIGQDKETTVIDGSSNGNVIRIIKDNVTLSGFTVQNSGYYYDIVILTSDGNNVTANRIQNGHRGIYLWDSSDNIIQGNIGTKIDEAAIAVNPGSGNEISQNILADNGIGIAIMWGSGSEGSNRIYRNKIESNENAIFALSDKNTEIFENKITSCDYGVDFIWSQELRVKCNFMGENLYGLYFVQVNSNVYRNTFINNTSQALVDMSSVRWSDRWNVTGSFWSDYTGNDTDGDGIGDTAYHIYDAHEDKNPLMNPYLPGDINHDGFVDIRDISTVARAHGTKPGDLRWNAKADLNEDAIIDDLDLDIVVPNFGETWQSYLLGRMLKNQRHRYITSQFVLRVHE